MGQEDFDKFVENGKIEIIHTDPKDKKKQIKYELDQDARIYNRTANQFYCVDPICSSNLPLHDQIAIKYTYLKTNIKKIEKVANKRDLGIPQSRTQTQTRRDAPFVHQPARLDGTGDIEYQHPPTTTYQGGGNGRPDYSNYVDYLESMGWRRAQLTLDEDNTRIIERYDLQSGTTGEVFSVQCPVGQKMSIMGTMQTQDVYRAHVLRIRLADEDDVDIPFNTRVDIVKEKPSEEVLWIARAFYADFSMTKMSARLGQIPVYKADAEMYRFRQGIELNGPECLKIRVRNCERNIASRNIRIAIDCDFWQH